MSLGRSTPIITHSLECSGSEEVEALSSTASMSYAPHPYTKAGSRATSRATTPTFPCTPPNSPERPNTLDADIPEGPTTMQNPPQPEQPEKGFLKIRGVQHAPKARLLHNRFTMFDERVKLTNHITDNAMHNKTPHVIKRNRINSYISELEAAAWAHYQLLVPDVVPTASRPYYNADGDYVAVSSRVIENYKPIHVRPLTEEELADDNISKSLAQCMTASYLFKEDDLHHGNLGVACDDNGRVLRVVRIDFDMSLWPILKEHKESNAADYTLRKRDTSHYVFTANDITKFPNLENCSPFYWPSRASMSSKNVITYFSKNAYTDNETTFFQKLKANTVFEFHQYQTMLKYALTTPDMYRALIKEYIREDLLHTDGRSLIEVLVDYQAHEIESMKSLLLTMPEFSKIFSLHGDTFLSNILADYEKRNSQLDLKIEKAATPERKEALRQLKIDLTDLTERFNQFSRLRTYNSVVGNRPSRLKK